MNLFLRPEVLPLILIVAAILYIVFLKSRKTALARLDKLVARKLKQQLIPRLSSRHSLVNFLFFLLAFVFILLGIAGPNWGTMQRTLSYKSNDVLFAIDLSRSMLADDISPNRLEKVKRALSNRLHEFAGCRLGLIGFSNQSFTFCPLTLDHLAFEKALASLEVGNLSPLGTDLSKPIEEASRIFLGKDSHKTLILISDGEDLEGKGLMQAKDSHKNGLKIYTLGVGTDVGSNIPTGSGNYHKDQRGEEVLTRLDASILREISNFTKGEYSPLGSTGQGISHLLSIINRSVQKTEFQELTSEIPIDRYQAFILVAFIVLLFDTLGGVSKLRFKNIARSGGLIYALLLMGFFKPTNVQKAEQAMEDGKPDLAAKYYIAEIDSITAQGDLPDARLLLNAGLAYSLAGSLDKAKSFLHSSIDQSDNPSIHSKALNSLGNLHYQEADFYLRNQDVIEARKAWKMAAEKYRMAAQLDANPQALANLESLENQIRERIEEQISRFQGVVWRDIDGNGKQDKNEPTLRSVIFWDKDGNGEHNASVEPAISSQENGIFGFEWIAKSYPNEIRLASHLVESNQSKSSPPLLPLFPPPPPPLDISQSRNHHLQIEKPGTFFVPMPWRAAPVIRGKVWNDLDQDGEEDLNESGLPGATIFIDLNGNLTLDENETTFLTEKDGSFAQVVPPGQHSVAIATQSEAAVVTFPIEETKAYLTWADFEKPSEKLMFGVFNEESSNESSQSEQSEQQEEQPEQSEQQEVKSEDREENSGEENEVNQQELSEPEASPEINAAYERYLQDTENLSKPLPMDSKHAENSMRSSGRDW